MADSKWLTDPLHLSSARLVRTKEFDHAPVLGAREMRGFFPGRATLKLDCAGDGWKLSASVANSPVEEKASARKMIDVLKTAIAVVEARIAEEGDKP